MNRLLVCLFLGAVLLGISLHPVDAHSQAIPPQGKVLFYAYAGAAKWNMTDVNNAIATYEGFLRGAIDPENPQREYLPANFSEFDVSWNLGGGIMFQLVKRVGIAVEYSYKPSSLDNQVIHGYQLDTGEPVSINIRDQIETNVQDLQLQLYYWPPLDDGMFLTVGAGYGWSSQTETNTTIQSQAEAPVVLQGDWTASSIAASVSAGYHFDAFWGTDFTFRGGYNFLNQGKPSGTTTRTDESGTVDDPDALPLKNLDWDYSGFFFTVSWGIGFGGG